MRRWLTISALLLACAAQGAEGLIAKFKFVDSEEVMVLPNFAFYISTNQSAFEAEISGELNSDLRISAVFSAVTTGEFILRVNGRSVLTNEGPSGSILLRKGTNTLSAFYKSKPGTENLLRVNWIPRRTFLQPIPARSLTHSEQLDNPANFGRALFLKHRCFNCHAAEGNSPELQMDAPDFNGIGSRLSGTWMSEWITKPRSMPDLFHGDANKAEAAAAYLQSLRGYPLNASKGDAVAGEKIYQAQNCNACHRALSLEHVGEKFKEGALEEYLVSPTKHFKWTQMPKYSFTGLEVANLAAYLRKGKKWKDLEANVTYGKELVETSGCLACHTYAGKKAGHTFPPLAKLNADKGCLADLVPTNAPNYFLTETQRTLLRKFVSAKTSIDHSPLEFAVRQLDQLNCRSCHGTVSGIPPVDLLGGKLRLQALEAMLAGSETDKPRYWMESQMPAFPQYSKVLAEGVAALHGFGLPEATSAPVNLDLAKAGHKLISAPPHGFSCISCHAVGEFGAKEPFESPGINLAHTYSRLNPEYFARWLRNPTLIDPLTKMPVYFDDDGRSPLIEIVEGEANKQIDAIWEYLKQPVLPAPLKE